MEDVLSIHPEQVLYLDEGEQVYFGDAQGMMEVVDYQRIKLPARIVMERARRDRPCPDVPARPATPHRPAAGRFRGCHFRYKPELPEVLHDINFQSIPAM